MSSTRRFWVSSVAASLGVAGVLGIGAPLVRRIEPRGGVWFLTASELWLLSVFTVGVLAVLLGLSVSVGGWFRGSAIRRGTDQWREGDETEPVSQEPDTEVSAGTNPLPLDPATRSSATRDPARWTILVGGQLLILYLVGSWIL